MRLLKRDSEIASFLETLSSRIEENNVSVEKTARKILEEVRAQGDKAVLKYTRKFDYKGARKIKLSPSEISRYAHNADIQAVKALELAARRIRKFHKIQTERPWSFIEGETILGQIIKPLKRVGIYVPGGKAAYPSTVLMNVIPAQVAGVKEIALCVPSHDGHMNPYVMAAVKMLDVREVYRIGGAQAIGALAFGTKTIKKVDKIVGPGNIFVATAKKLVFGTVDIDMIAGPSEILIIADESASPSFVAADLLSQAEHDEIASSVLITNSENLARQVLQEIAKQMGTLTRKKIAQTSIDNYGAIILTKNIEAAIDLSNGIAPEHLEVMTEKPMNILPLIENAGAVFLGPWTPEPVGDYAAGPNHTLPTGGTARFSSPLGVYDFYKRSSLIGFTKKGFMKIAKIVETIADIEGMEAHGNTIRIRKEKTLGSSRKRHKKGR
jgi:histidinol dehydrogenase